MEAFGLGNTQLEEAAGKAIGKARQSFENGLYASKKHSIIETDIFLLSELYIRDSVVTSYFIARINALEDKINSLQNQLNWRS